MRTSWLLISLAVHGAAVTAAIGFGAYAALQPQPPVAQIEIQQQIASVAVPMQVTPELEVTSEELVESVAVQELEVSEDPPLEKPAEAVLRPDVAPSPAEVMRSLTENPVLKKAKASPPAPAEIVEPPVEPVEPAPQPSVPQEYVEAQRSDNEPPPYPKREQRLSLEGQVTLRVSIDVKGAVTGVAFVERSRYRGFNRVAVEAVRQWKFTPATLDGVPVESETDIEVVFRLTDPK